MLLKGAKKEAKRSSKKMTMAAEPSGEWSDELSEDPESSAEWADESSERGLDRRIQTFKALYPPINLTPARIFFEMLTFLSIGACIKFASEGKLTEFIQFFSLSTGLFCITDPFRILRRLVSVQARVLITMDAALVLVGTYVRNVRYAGVSFLFCLATALAIYYFNSVWLSGNIWIMNEHVRRALIQDKDSKGVIAWEQCGRREIRTLLSELGLEYDNWVLENYGRAIFIAGFYNAVRSTTKSENRAAAAEKKLEAFKERARLDKVIQDNQKASDEVDKELEAIKAENDRLKQVEVDYHDAKKRYEDAEYEAHRLMEANEEMVSQLPAEALAKTVVSEEEAKRNYIIKLLNSKNEKTGKNIYSLKTISDMAGVSKYYVEKVKKEEGIK